MARKLKNINGPWYAGIDLEGIAANHGFSLADCRLSPNLIRFSWQLLRDHFGFAGYPFIRP